MKKIGIITIHNSHNYGACLQAFALYKYIELQGNDCEIIDLHRPIHKDYIYEKKYSSYRNNPFTIKLRLKNGIKKCLLKLFRHNTSYDAFTSKIAEDRFRKFNATIKYSKAYYRISDLKKDPPIYDLYISGSDQLWNPSQPYCLEPYFLTFVPDGKKKISYATSIGITELTYKEQNDFKQWLDSYDAISIRENQAKLLLDSFMNKNIIQVADPTFLLDASFWKEIAIYPSTGQKYILLFMLSKNEDIINYAIRLKNESKLQLIILKNTRLRYNPNNYIIDNDCGPLEFLGYLGNADMVITDSFHCTVFSLLMGAKNFYSYISPNSKRGSRITDLLETFGLLNHLLPSGLSMNYETLIHNKINFANIEEIIESEKVRSRNFLDKWIKN